MLRIILSLIIYSCTLSNIMGQPLAYQIFSSEGKPTTFSKIVEDALERDIILFGEYHDQPICHWLQKLMLEELHKQSQRKIVVGMEMFETDNQLIIDEYFKGLISNSKFEAEARFWNNYKQDYKPMLDYAKQNQLQFVGTNVPGRYANTTYMQGINTLLNLSNEAKAFLPPLPIPLNFELPGYARLLKMGGGGHGGQSGENFPAAQALRDATMAYSILKYMDNNTLFYHLNGTYHSDDFEGINYYLKEYNPKYRILTISTVYQKDITTLDIENINKGNYILCIPENMNKSY
jgi:uncharacterized iron-regulated protein